MHSDRHGEGDVCVLFVFICDLYDVGCDEKIESTTNELRTEVEEENDTRRGDPLGEAEEPSL